MTIIEGIGDEVVYILAVFVIVTLLTLVWMSTQVRPLWNGDSMWLVQLRTSPTRSVVEVSWAGKRAHARVQLTQIGSHEASRLARESNARIVRVTEAAQRGAPEAGDDGTTEAGATPSTGRDAGDGVNVSFGDEAPPLVPQTPADADMLNSVLTAQYEYPVVDSSSKVHIVCVHANTRIDLAHSTPNTSFEHTDEPTLRRRTAAAQPSTDDTGATPTATSGDALIRLKFVDDTSRLVHAFLSYTVAEFKRVHFEPAVSAGECVRLIYAGQLLRDDTRSLASYGIQDHSTVHCHISRTPYTQQQQQSAGTTSTSARGERRAHIGAAHARSGGHVPTVAPQPPQHWMNTARLGVQFDIGNYIHVIFAGKFVLLWLFFVLYPQYFDFSAFFSLVVCTAVYAAFVAASVRAGRRTAAAATANAQPTTDQ